LEEAVKKLFVWYQSRSVGQITVAHIHTGTESTKKKRNKALALMK
jgi:hypothetical protein